MFSRFTLTALAALTIIPAINADEILMKNGSRLVGDLVSAEADKVVFDTPFAGRITIKQENIERITTEEPVTLMMEDGTVYRDRQIISTETAMLVEAENEKTVIFAAQDIEMVNPEPWKLGKGYDWTGRISLAMEYERGNSNSDEWHLQANSVWRSLVDRYTLKGDKEYEESKNVKKEDNWFAYGKYDRFLEPGSQNYRGFHLSYEYDEFADLDLRSIYGVHAGRDFSDNPHFTLQMELGPAWVDEQFIEAPSDSWLGIMWTATATSDIIGFGSTLYLDHDGIFNTSDPRDTILNATVGIRFPIAGGFETALEAEFEYDGGAVENVDQLDETYTLNFGYSW
ncbi:Unannotated [Lentimonas sp. CC4]|nr:Unannotated [Lentimonas sp. CC4]CAA6686849.1 Unannotated [Lentimonas sp. CC6]CAA7074550.1 Unannotated [Lentimonas sp. CC4]CAA7169166.1 Unannotated [Lentimonas sp. CC21]CAA7180433.1 Unannotated [Lentimonas sp. CC8]